LLFTALVLGFLFNTQRIFQQTGGFSGFLLKFFWFVAFGYGGYTIWVGNQDLIVGTQVTGAQAFLLIGLTLLMVSSPIALSWLWQRRREAST
jgi:hypothetical protein